MRDSRELQRRTLEGDAAYVADAVRRAHDSAAGPHYYNDEQALRAAVKLAYIRSVDDYLRVAAAARQAGCVALPDDEPRRLAPQGGRTLGTQRPIMHRDPANERTQGEVTSHRFCAGRDRRGAGGM